MGYDWTWLTQPEAGYIGPLVHIYRIPRPVPAPAITAPQPQQVPTEPVKVPAKVGS